MSRVNVDDFRITEDGRTVVYSSRPKLPEKSAEIDREGLRGWRFDARAFPVRGARPQTPDADRFLASVDLEEGREREARADGDRRFDEIGRASCRERGGRYVVILGGAGSLKKK